ncbi:MAG: hypothetical protein WDO14_19150 [Bacteroidota bacterium]
MQLRITILYLFLLTTNVVMAQITGFATDPKAIPITAEAQMKLSGKTWYCSKLIEVRRTARQEFEPFHKTIEFKPGGQYNKNGTWTIVNDQFIKITEPEVAPNAKPFLSGAYSIYALSDSVLVLGKILTSSGDFTREYTFTTTPVDRSLKLPKEVTYNLRDSLRDGEYVTRYPDGQVKSKENYKLVRTKVPKEQYIYWTQLKVTGLANPEDSTMSNSYREGKWSYFYPDGKIKTRQFFAENYRTGQWQYFSEDGRLVKTERYGYEGGLEFSDRYHYQASNSRPTIERQIRGNIMFVMGSKDSVLFDQLELYNDAPIHSEFTEVVRVINLSQKKVTLNISANSTFDIHPTEFVIEANDTSRVVLKLTMPAGQTDSKIQVTSSEWTYEIPLHSFGYHISNADFDSKDKKILPVKFFFHRISDDHQLEIVGNKKSKTVALSKQMNEIELKKGLYKFILVGKSGRKTIDVEIR